MCYYELEKLAVIMISVRGQEEVKVKCLENGADDYITKPFSAVELIARLNAVLRRKINYIINEIFENAGLRLEFNTRTVILHDQSLKLTSIEYSLLTTLTRNAGRIFLKVFLILVVFVAFVPTDGFCDEQVVKGAGCG